MKIRSPIFMRMYLLLLFLIAINQIVAYSQEISSCAEKLKNAQTLFEKGQVEQVPAILHDCMKNGFNREESLAAYKLLIQSYLFEDKQEKADSTMLAFLKKNPEYKISPTDHSSFVNLYNTFNVRPVVLISFHIGPNLPFLTFVDPISAASIGGENTYNTDALNFFGSFEASFLLTNRLEFNVEAGYSQLKFTNIAEFMGIGETEYNEIQKKIDLPLSLTYKIADFGIFTPYLRLGAGPSFTLSSTSKTAFNALDMNGTDHTGTDINRNDSRKFIDIFAQAGAGIKVKTRGGYIFAELRSNFGMFNQTAREGKSAEELRWYYYYVDDDFHLNSLNFTLGYTQIFYKPSKRKE